MQRVHCLSYNSSEVQRRLTDGYELYEIYPGSRYERYGTRDIEYAKMLIDKLKAREHRATLISNYIKRADAGSRIYSIIYKKRL